MRDGPVCGYHRQLSNWPEEYLDELWMHLVDQVGVELRQAMTAARSGRLA